MITKVKHHPLLTSISFYLVFCVLALTLGLVFSPQWFWLFALGFTLYMLGFFWSDNYYLMCPQDNHVEYDKTKYYCSSCGSPLVFRKIFKVKVKGEPKPDRINILTCSKGHKISSYDKYCSHCGEPLKDDEKR
jgi:hypothetical protein